MSSDCSRGIQAILKVPWPTKMKPATGQLDDFFQKELPSLKLTFSHPKMDGWNTSFLLGLPMFRGENAVSFRESSMTSFPAGRGIQADGSAV